MEKYQIDTEENKAFMQEIREDLLRFGCRFPSPGGSSYYLGDDGTPWKDRPRETFITARMGHVYALGALLGYEGTPALADEALSGLRGELRDVSDGGWYTGITRDGKILPDKQCYAHAFVMLAASSALLADRPGAAALLTEAQEVYDQYFWDEKEGISCDSWDTGFTRENPYRGLNANMHSVEAFLAVADASGQETYRKRAGRVIDRVIDWAADHSWRIPEHYTVSWVPMPEYNREHPSDPFKPYGATPGHGMEWARLMVQYSRSSRYLHAAENLYQRAVTDGWEADGAPGFVYTTDWNGVPVVHDRMHWVLAEAINTSAVLYRVTKKAGYAKDYERYLAYLDDKVLDHVNGSWFHQLDRDNHPVGTVFPGKNDLYHAVQATLIPYYDPSLSIARAVKEGRKL